MPSPKSRESGFYYGHPQNCFWRTLSLVLGQGEPAADAASRREFLLKNRIALWDVLSSCEIDGASDASIRRPVANKFRSLIEATEISAVFAAGRKAAVLFERHCAAEAGMEAIYLPSTSPANRLRQAGPEFIRAWMKVKEHLAEG
jgi:hypoxanthine-DNA glycosylase